MKTIRLMLSSAAVICALLCFNPAGATETENHGLRVLPAPGRVTIDGKVDDWDLSGGIFACGELEHLRDRSSVWLHAMYDADNLYILARWKDETPLNNPEALGGHGFNGDCLQFRCLMFPNTKDQTATWWDCWRDNQGRSVIERSSPGAINGFRDNPLPSITDGAEQGVKQAFQIDAAGKGYIQEISVPWKLLSASGAAPQIGDRFRFTIEPNFTAGVFGRITIKDIFDDSSKSPDRVFTFRSYKDWGWATLSPSGKVAPQPVRLADGRTFPVTMQNGVPVVDWTGLVRHFEWPGFKAINFTMPFSGDVSLNLIDRDGVVVRHLLNQDHREAGPVTVMWDGLTDACYRTPGQPVPPGTYRWKAIAHPPATVTFRGYAAFSGKAPWQGSADDFWLGDHGVPSDVVTDGERMYLACNGAEGGRHLIATDFQGHLIWGLQNTTGAADPETIAVDRGTVYVLHPSVTWMKSSVMISRVDAKTGAYEPWVGRKSHMLAATDAFGADSHGYLVGLDAKGGILYGTTGDSVVTLDGGTGALIHQWPLEHAAAIKDLDGRTAYVICGNDVRSFDMTTGTSQVLVDGLTNPASLAIAPDGRILVSVGAPDNQVLVFDAHGKELGRIGDKGGREVGPWQPDRMLNPSGIAVDAIGHVWVMEHDAWPKRVSVWTFGAAGAPITTSLVKDFYGPTHYGASGGAIDPRDPNLMVGEGCEWRMDPATGQSVCLGTFDRSFHDFATYREGANGRLYLYTNKMRYGTGSTQVWERLGDARFALRAEINNNVEGADPKVGMTEVWTDLNGDGLRQPNEIQQRTGSLYCSGSNSWSLNLGPDLALYAYDKLDGQLKKISVTGVAASGAPVYDLAHLTTLPDTMSTGYQNNYSCAVPSADNKSILVNLADRDNPAGFVWHCFDLASGKLKWTYPNPYFQVGGSHSAPAPDPGLFRGAYGPIGSANLPGVGNFWIINGNLGEWWALSADGFYLTRVFSGNVFDWAWPTEPLPGSDFTNLPAGSGGEDFGGSITQAKDGKVYMQAGKVGIWNLTLNGLDKTVSIRGGSVTISAPEALQALALREQSLQAATTGESLTVSGATITFTGNFDRDFAACDKVSYQKNEDAAVRTALAWDSGKLYIGWQVKDPTPWVNGATDMSQMYSCGDTVDLQLGTNLNADPKRTKAVSGDLRLSIGNLQGKDTAVLYKFVSDRKQPRVFSSGVVQGWKVDYVDTVPQATIKVTISPGKGYLVEAAVPLDSLGLAPTNTMTLRGDVGVTHGDPAGQRTRLRTYWSNQETGLVDDVVFELQPNPANWGDFDFR